MTNINQTQVSADLHQKYKDFYSENQIDKWRELGAKYKVENIVSVAGNHRFEKVLEVGAGEGSVLKEMSNLKFCKELYALEISESGINSIKSKNIERLISVMQFDGYKIPYKDNHFDLVVISHVLEHVEFPRILLREIKRVSKFQIIEVPRDYKFNVDKRAKHFLDYGHINVYTPTLLRFLLISEGFEILNDRMTLSTKDVMKFQLNSDNFIKNLKLNLFILIRFIAYALVAKHRKETMINAYTVLIKASN